MCKDEREKLFKVRKKEWVGVGGRRGGREGRRGKERGSEGEEKENGKRFATQIYTTTILLSTTGLLKKRRIFPQNILPKDRSNGLLNSGCCCRLSGYYGSEYSPERFC